MGGDGGRGGSGEGSLIIGGVTRPGVTGLGGMATSSGPRATIPMNMTSSSCCDRYVKLLNKKRLEVKVLVVNYRCFN
jgi:hypothetical protein